MTVEEADARTNVLPSGENGLRLGPQTTRIKNKKLIFPLWHKGQNLLTNLQFML